MNKPKKKKSRKRKLNFLKKSKPSNVQSRHVVGPTDFRKKKYMRDPQYDTPPTTYYPDRKK